jgi:hypothetical protein
MEISYVEKKRKELKSADFVREKEEKPSPRHGGSS